MYIPTDPEILFSMVNMKLRDSYESLQDFCEDAGIEREEIELVLNAAGYYFNEETNQFR